MKAVKIALLMIGYASLAARANVIQPQGPGCPNPKAAKAESSPCDWYQWADSGPVSSWFSQNQGESGSDPWGHIQGPTFKHEEGPSFKQDEHENPVRENNPAPVPEPGTLALMGLGLLAMLAGVRRRAKA